MSVLKPEDLAESGNTSDLENKDGKAVSIDIPAGNVDATTCAGKFNLAITQQEGSSRERQQPTLPDGFTASGNTEPTSIRSDCLEEDTEESIIENLNEEDLLGEFEDDADIENLDNFEDTTFIRSTQT